MRITDNGCGIPQEIVGRICDPFFSTKQDHGGVGLGLTISMAVVQDHGGQMLFAFSTGSGHNRHRLPERSRIMPHIPSKHPIFIVDDEQRLLEGVNYTLRSAGYDDVATFNNGRDILSFLPDLECSLVLLDLYMPDVSGEEVLLRLREECPHVVVVVITGVDETETAVRCMKAGAFDYLVNPVEPEQLIATVRRALSHAVLIRQNFNLRQRLLTGKLDHPEAFAGIITANRKMNTIFQYLEVVAPASDPVLVTGETGTGKDLIVSALHQISGRDGPLVALNAAGLDDNIFADTLFGHVKGAFTDAAVARQGMVEQARNGTLFLDEIGDLTLSSQIKLLKLIQDREFYPLGADNPRQSRARIVLATNRNLEDEVRRNRFRKDLFYRINTYHVHLPPLRERPEDIPLLANYYLAQAAEEFKSSFRHIEPQLSNFLQAYNFPGNVRELRALIFNAVAHGGQEILIRSLSRLLKTSHPPVLQDNPPSEKIMLFPDPLPTMDQAIELLVREAMRRAHGNQAAAARMLGISRQAMHKRVH
ncbi:two component, sigma54 specific, transcriptional regulator, Fis family [Desulfonatronum thiosulfatophilum]|uniref:histidine kinase n=2 Tax=Desulfonatronum thiosulfatophilum TaxID=617002 RepID=A0A1G6A957_9BACT|nr:two component, sigma54 specific, transcriptional regulator, Fis family [Desulfonatronum thiosulfatophilum]